MARDNSHTYDNISTRNNQNFNKLSHAKSSLASKETAVRSASVPASLTACVIDLDNVCSRQNQRGVGAWACLDIVAFIAAIRQRGVTAGTVFQNRKSGDYASKLWAAGGLSCVATGRNVDDDVKLAAVHYASAGFDCVILVASDGGYDEVIHTIRRCGIRVELWALRSAVASHLMFAADAVRWIDHFVREPGIAA